MNAIAYLRCLNGIIHREALRFLNQRGRFIAALVRPLVWLFIFAAGFRAVLGVSIIPPYDTYVLYEVYVVPGLVAMIQLFNRSEEHTSELQSLMRISYAVFCLKKKKTDNRYITSNTRRK